MLIKDSAQGVHILGALSDQPIPTPENGSARLLRDSFGRDKAHLGLARGDDDRLGISCIIFLALD